jgi:hypothetical protein
MLSEITLKCDSLNGIIQMGYISVFGAKHEWAFVVGHGKRVIL